MDPYQEMLRIVAALKEARIPYAICGGLALLIHGHPRFTKDIDLLMRARDIERAKAAVRPLGFNLHAAPMTFGVKTERETRVHRVSKLEGDDLLILDLLEIEPGFKEVWKGRLQIETDEGRLSAVSRDGLILMKRRAGRAQDLADIAKLEGTSDEPQSS